MIFIMIFFIHLQFTEKIKTNPENYFYFELHETQQFAFKQGSDALSQF